MRRFSLYTISAGLASRCASEVCGMNHLAGPLDCWMCKHVVKPLVTGSYTHASLWYFRGIPSLVPTESEGC